MRGLERGGDLDGGGGLEKVGVGGGGGVGLLEVGGVWKWGRGVWKGGVWKGRFRSGSWLGVLCHC